MKKESILGRFEEAIKRSYGLYGKHGPRSNKKLKPLHEWVSSEISGLVGAGYEVHSLNTIGKGGEKSVDGKYYKKWVDISVVRNGKCAVIVSVKFVTSNYQQNANNYFEHLLGGDSKFEKSRRGCCAPCGDTQNHPLLHERWQHIACGSTE